MFVTENKLRKAFQKSIGKITRLHFIFAMLREVFYFNSSPKKKEIDPLKIFPLFSISCFVLFPVSPTLCQRSLLWTSQKSYYTAISITQEKQTKNPYLVIESDFWTVIHFSLLQYTCMHAYYSGTCQEAIALAQNHPSCCPPEHNTPILYSCVVSTKFFFFCWMSHLATKIFEHNRAWSYHSQQLHLKGCTFSIIISTL